MAGKTDPMADWDPLGDWRAKLGDVGGDALPAEGAGAPGAAVLVPPQPAAWGTPVAPQHPPPASAHYPHQASQPAAGPGESLYLCSLPMGLIQGKGRGCDRNDIALRWTADLPPALAARGLSSYEWGKVRRAGVGLETPGGSCDMASEG